ncbi:hypothetical protein PM033_17320, partial [Halorubrum ezzemoulense]|nr:hypothetical protein [Halorubrum ezzemoulense]
HPRQKNIRSVLRSHFISDSTQHRLAQLSAQTPPQRAAKLQRMLYAHSQQNLTVIQAALAYDEASHQLAV